MTSLYVICGLGPPKSKILATPMVLGMVKQSFLSFLKVFTVFESFTVCVFSLSFKEFFKFQFLQLVLLPLRVAAVIKV